MRAALRAGAASQSAARCSGCTSLMAARAGLQRPIRRASGALAYQPAPRYEHLSCDSDDERGDQCGPDGAEVGDGEGPCRVPRWRGRGVLPPSVRMEMPPKALVSTWAVLLA